MCRQIMAPLFLVLATLNTLALVATGVVGILSRRFDDAWYLSHFTLGLFTAIGTLLLHCIIFTYFLGTGRWVKEVGLAYHLPDGGWPRQTRELKRTAFPAALFAMLTTIAAAAAGAGVRFQEWPNLAHQGLAAAALLVNLWAYRVEYRCLTINAQILEEVMNEVDRIRAQHGLASNAQALRQAR